MKKVYLSLIALFCGYALFAQQAAPPVVSNPIPQELSNEIQLVPSPKEHESSAYRAAPRWYSSVDAVDQSQGGTGAIYSNANFNTIWEDSTINLPYSDGLGGTVYEPVWIRSISQVLDPADPIFNNPAAYAGEAHISRMQPYTLDSVGIYGVYTRNPSKPSIVDTLVVSVIRGDGTGTMNDLDIRFWGPTAATSTNHGTDTLRFIHGFLELNPASANAYTWIASSPGNKFDIKIPLTAVTANDTLSNGFNYFSFPVNLSVPAGEVLDMSMTFKSGDTWVPLVDSVYISGSFATPNYNNLRFVSFEEVNSSFQTYTKGYYNCSNLMRTDTSGWQNWHIPSYAFSNATYSYEQHWFEWKLNCPSCFPVAVKNFEEEIGFNLFPNPASNEVSISMNLRESVKNAEIDIMNTTGQLVQHLELGNLSAQLQNHKIDLSNFAPGIYILNIDLDGQKLVKKLIVQ